MSEEGELKKRIREKPQLVKFSAGNDLEEAISVYMPKDVEDVLEEEAISVYMPKDVEDVLEEEAISVYMPKDVEDVLDDAKKEFWAWIDKIAKIDGSDWFIDELTDLTYKWFGEKDN